ETDQRHLTGNQLTRDGRVEVVARGERAMADRERFDACGRRPLQPFGFRAVRNDHGDPRIEPPLVGCVNQCPQIAAPARDEDADRSIHPMEFARIAWRAVVRDCHGCLGSYTTPAPPGSIEPITFAPDSPAFLIWSTTSAVRSRDTTRISPIPMLNGRSMSSSGTRPVVCNHSKSAGTFHRVRSMTACMPSGRTRGRLSVIPPPVMCAIPLIAPEPRIGRRSGRYDRCVVSSDLPIVAPS